MKIINQVTKFIFTEEYLIIKIKQLKGQEQVISEEKLHLEVFIEQKCICSLKTMQ